MHRHLIRASLGPPESKCQTASRMVRPFLHSSQQRINILHNGPPLSLFKLPLPMGDLGPLLPRANPSPQFKRHLDRFSRFCRAYCCDRQTDRSRYSVCKQQAASMYIVLRCCLKIRVRTYFNVFYFTYATSVSL